MAAPNNNNNNNTASSGDEKQSSNIANAFSTAALARDFAAPPIANSNAAATSNAFRAQDVYRSLAVASAPVQPMGALGSNLGSQMHDPHAHMATVGLDGSAKAFSSFQSSNPFAKPAPISAAVLSTQNSAELLIPPPVIGGYLEPNRHVFTYTSPLAVLDAVRKALVVLDVDFTVDRAAFAFQCSSYRVATKVNFAVHVFAADKNAKEQQREESKWVIEVQRRAGCVVAFSEVYSSIMSNLEKEIDITGRAVDAEEANSSADGAVDGPVPCSWDPLPLPDLGDLSDLSDFEFDMEPDADAIAALIQMAQSECVDVALEGFQAIAEMSMQNENHTALVEQQVIPVLIQRLESKNTDLRRCAVTCLANMASNVDQICAELSCNMESVLPLCNAQCRQMVRETMRLLAAVASVKRNEMACEALSQCVTGMLVSPDKQTRSFASKVRELTTV